MAIDALKIKSSISRSFVIAGNPFTITTTVTNVHDDEIEVIEYFYHIPFQVQWINDGNYRDAYKELQKKNFFLRLFKVNSWRRAAEPPGEAMSYADRKTPEKSIGTIRPGETLSYSFKAIVPKWLFSTGSEISFTGRVTYKYKNETHNSQFQVSFIKRPPLSANIIGAIIGGILGTTAKYLKDVGSSDGSVLQFSFLSASALAIILGVIMVVFSSRRTADTQPILTIEDIWGGMLAGFLVGYLGHEFFSKVVAIGN